MARVTAIGALVLSLIGVTAAAGLGPEVTGVAPDPAAPAPAAQLITVSGRNFIERLTVSVTTPSGAVDQYRDRSIQDLRETSFQAAVVLASAGTYRLSVTNPDGKTSSPFTMTVKAPAATPTISGIDPAELHKSMNQQTLTVRGAQFVPGLSATVTDPAGNVVTISGGAIGQVTSTSARVTATLELAGDYSIVVTNPSGAVSNSFGF